MSAFGGQLRTLILERYTSLRQFAMAIGMDPTYLSRYVNGHIERPERETLERMAPALGLTVAELAHLAGVIPVDAAPAPDPATPDESPIDEQAIVAYIESLPGPAFHARLARVRASLPPASYTALCVRLYKAWMSNGELALDAYSLGRL